MYIAPGLIAATRGSWRRGGHHAGVIARVGRRGAGSLVGLGWLVGRGGCDVCGTGSSAGAGAVERADAPLPRGLLGNGEANVVPAVQGLQGHEHRRVFEQHPGPGGGLDLGRADGASQRLPADRRPVQPPGQFDAAARVPAVVDFGEGGDPPVRRGQAQPFGARSRDGTARLPAVAEVDRDETGPVRSRPGRRCRGQVPQDARDRPAVGLDRRVMAAGPGRPRAAGDPLGDPIAQIVPRAVPAVAVARRRWPA